MLDIRTLCCKTARRLYGDTIPDAISNRMEEELRHILRNGFAEPYRMAARIVDKANREGYLIDPRGSVGSSFVAFLLGITDINPMPPHYLCESCNRLEWAKNRLESGFDLSNKRCPECGGNCKGDGHNIPFEMFLGIDGNIPPKITLYVDKEFEESAKEELIGFPQDANPSLLMPDILVHDVLSILNRLHIRTGVNPRNIPMNDPKVLSLFRSANELEVTPEKIMSTVGTYGIPEMGNAFVREMLELTQPSSFQELVQISGLSHGTGTWDTMNRERIQTGAVPLSALIGSRDQLMMELMDYGMDLEAAYAIADSVRKGKGIFVSCREAMSAFNIPDRYIESCQKIRYLFPKAMAVSYGMRAVQCAFFKLYYPLEFYAAYLAIRSNREQMELITQGYQAIKEMLDALQSDADRRLFELALEITARGMRIQKSGERYAVENHSESLDIPLSDFAY